MVYVIYWRDGSRTATTREWATGPVCWRLVREGAIVNVSQTWRWGIG